MPSAPCRLSFFCYFSETAINSSIAASSLSASPAQYTSAKLPIEAIEDFMRSSAAAFSRTAIASVKSFN